MLSAKELINLNIEKQKKDKTEYKYILQSVYDKIKKRNNENFLNCLFIVPYAKPGSTLNNVNELTPYLIHELNKGGFVAYPYRGSLNTIYIDWSINIDYIVKRKSINVKKTSNCRKK